MGSKNNARSLSAEMKAVANSVLEQFKINLANKIYYQKKADDCNLLQEELAELYKKITYSSIHDLNITISDDFIKEHHREILQEDTNVNRFWRDNDFAGWKAYTIAYIELENKFMSLKDFVIMTGETDKLERKALQSAISNAITNNLASNRLIAIKAKTTTGKFYGLPKFIDENENKIKSEYLKKIALYEALPEEYFEVYKPNKVKTV